MKTISTPLLSQSGQLEVNQSARKARHQRVFSGGVFVRASRLSLPRFFSIPRLFAAKGASSRQTIQSILSPYLHVRKREAQSVTSDVNKLFRRYAGAVAALFVLGTIAPSGAYYDDASAQVYTGIEEIAYESVLLTDAEGYLTKMNPQTSSGDRSAMNDLLVHTVASGETVSTIAEQYGLKSSTVLWENGLSNANSIRAGSKLLIPPVDGITHKVAKGENVEKIAKTYGVDAEAVKKQNRLVASTLTAGQEIFVPGAKPLITDTPVRATPSRVGTSSRSGGAVLPGSNDIPVGDKPFIFPTRGKLTQGFRKGHYAFDIADSSKPPIWAAGAGTVVKASEGTYGGGYGNHVIIDHGNGLKTLYAHMDYVSVKEGDVVTQGQVLGRQGNTGRTYGRTGIHLHFEVIKNGVKQVPSNYY